MLCDIFDYFHTCQGTKQMPGERDWLVNSIQMNYAVQTMGTLKNKQTDKKPQSTTVGTPMVVKK